MIQVTLEEKTRRSAALSYMNDRGSGSLKVLGIVEVRDQNVAGRQERILCRRVGYKGHSVGVDISIRRDG